MFVCFVFFFKQKTAYEMRISDWSSDVCSSDLDDSGRLSSEMESSRRLSDGRPQLCRTTAQSGKKNWSGHQAPSPRKIAERIANRIMTGAGRFKLPALFIYIKRANPVF